MKKLGTYTYKRFAGQVLDTRHNRNKPTFTEHTLRVEVLGETLRKYQVKYLGFHANGAAVGYVTWVKKDKVALDVAEPTQVQPGPPREDIRLPYKD